MNESVRENVKSGCLMDGDVFSRLLMSKFWEVVDPCHECSRTWDAVLQIAQQCV